MRWHLAGLGLTLITILQDLHRPKNSILGQSVPIAEEGVANWTLLDYVWMMSLSKWSRLYINKRRGTGSVVLTISKVKPQHHSCGLYTVVMPKMVTKIIDTKDRAKVAARRAAGVQWTYMPVLSWDQKKEAQEQSKDLILAKNGDSMSTMRGV